MDKLKIAMEQLAELIAKRGEDKYGYCSDADYANGYDAGLESAMDILVELQEIE